MALPAKKTLEIFFDVVSPYAWIGFEVISRYQHKWNIDLKLKPFFLGGVMQGSDNRAPLMVPNKGAYMYKDLARLARYYQLPLIPPANPADLIYNKGSLAAMRFVTAVDMNNPELTESLSRELWLRAWSKDEPITDAEHLTEAGRKAGLSDSVIQDALQKIKSSEVKDRLRAHTDEALAHGAFGAPTFVTLVNEKPEMVFGSDRFHILADLLGEKYVGPLNELNKAKL